MVVRSDLVDFSGRKLARVAFLKCGNVIMCNHVSTSAKKEEGENGSYRSREHKFKMTFCISKVCASFELLVRDVLSLLSLLSLTEEFHEVVFECDLRVFGEAGLEGGHVLGPGFNGGVLVEHDNAVCLFELCCRF